MLIPPTLTAILAALTQANFPLGVMLNDLPSANSYQVLDLLGGFAILSSDGVVLFNNWDSQSLDAGALTTEFFKLIHFA